MTSEAQQTARPGRRLKSMTLLAGVVVSGLTLIAWTQPWFTVTVGDAEASSTALVAAGDVAAAGLSALGLAGLALVGAISIAGPVFRLVLGVLEMLIGVAVLVSTGAALRDPIAASAQVVTDATGRDGPDSVAEIVVGTAATPWPWIALALGVLTVAIGLSIVIVGRRWPGSTRKYQAVRFEADDTDAGERAMPAGAADPAADWDALSEGDDPTRR